jgi:hypothetical protein
MWKEILHCIDPHAVMHVSSLCKVFGYHLNVLPVAIHYLNNVLPEQKKWLPRFSNLHHALVCVSCCAHAIAQPISTYEFFASHAITVLIEEHAEVFATKATLNQRCVRIFLFKTCLQLILIGT